MYLIKKENNIEIYKVHSDDIFYSHFLPQPQGRVMVDCLQLDLYLFCYLPMLI